MIVIMRNYFHLQYCVIHSLSMIMELWSFIFSCGNLNVIEFISLFKLHLTCTHIIVIEKKRTKIRYGSKILGTKMMATFFFYLNYLIFIISIALWFSNMILHFCTNEMHAFFKIFLEKIQVELLYILEGCN
jgi:hypothetical protein